LDTKKAIKHWKASGLDLAPLLQAPVFDTDAPRRNLTTQDHGLVRALDNKLIELAAPALKSGEVINIEMPIKNVNRTVGTMLGSEITREFGGAGLAENTANISLHGTAGNSFGAFIPKGLTLRLYGDANDYVGKGLSGGRVIVRPDEKATFASELNVIAGNVIGYGSTSGEIFIRGRVGERFCVRNSGAVAVVEGIGDHGCEYMTGGVALILGRTGRNLAAGMSGGRAFVLDLDAALVNTELVDVLVMPADQEKFVKELLSKFEAETGSVVAAQLLKNWDESKKRISMIMPRDYARVLAAMARAEREGLPIDKVVMEAVNG
jgi:glutamate synthase (NADPH/NADH) large chain